MCASVERNTSEHPLPYKGLSSTEFHYAFLDKKHSRLNSCQHMKSSWSWPSFGDASLKGTTPFSRKSHWLVRHLETACIALLTVLVVAPHSEALLVVWATVEGLQPRTPALLKGTALHWNHNNDHQFIFSSKRFSQRSFYANSQTFAS